MKAVKVKDLGLMRYAEAWDLQEQLFAHKLNLKSENRNLPEEAQKVIEHDLLLVEHPPVYTLGKSGSQDNLLISEEFLKEIGAEYFHINRGGDITFHGPGQMVVYPILDLEQFKTDIGWYMRSLEEAVIRTLQKWGIESERYPGYTGVWLEAGNPRKARKICAMGVRTSRWVSMHGIALNVNTDLRYFEYMVPCGIKEYSVTSMAQELGRAVDFQEVQRVFLAEMASLFDFVPVFPLS